MEANLEWILEVKSIRDRIPVGTRFLLVQTGPGAQVASCTRVNGSFPGGRGGRGVELTSNSHLMQKDLEKIIVISLLTLRACVACKKGIKLPLRRQVRVKGKIGLNRSVMYIYPFPLLSAHFFIYAASTQ